MKNQQNIDSAKKYAIEVKSYSKKFGKFVAVDNVSFKVNIGKIHGFIGPNGAGKTTTIKAIIGAYSQTKGEILIQGFQAGSAKAKAQIGYIPERASFPAHLNCLEYLITMAEMSGLKNKVAKAKSLAILEELNLSKFMFRKPITFSSGMKKKILVAQALILTPSVLVLDEPAANLDPTARKDMFEMYKKVRATGTSILLSSHILTELQDIVEEVTFISQGKIRYTGSIEDLSAEEGLIISFLNSQKKEPQAFIKKHKLINTTTGWKKITKNKDETNKIVSLLIKSNINVMNVSFLKGNLSSAYDKLVVEHDKVFETSQKPKKNWFFKLKNTNQNLKLKKLKVKPKTKKGGK